jgi:hypothetical protein
MAELSSIQISSNNRRQRRKTDGFFLGLKSPKTWKYANFFLLQVKLMFSILNRNSLIFWWKFFKPRVSPQFLKDNPNLTELRQIERQIGTNWFKSTLVLPYLMQKSENDHSTNDLNLQNFW